MMEDCYDCDGDGLTGTGDQCPICNGTGAICIDCNYDALACICDEDYDNCYD